MYWKAKAQPHKSSEYYCAVPHACIYNMTHGRETRAPKLFIKPQKTIEDKVSNLLTCNEFGESSSGCIPMSSSAEMCYSVCPLQKVQRKVDLQVAADT